jgi:hypothetical protein
MRKLFCAMIKNLWFTLCVFSGRPRQVDLVYKETSPRRTVFSSVHHKKKWTEEKAYSRGRLFILVTIIIFPCFSQVYLKGELKGIFPCNNYVVTEDIIVKKGDTLVFNAGSELIFFPKTKIQVYGFFGANGRRDKGITFSSLHRNNFTAKAGSEKITQPDYWNGIVVFDSSATIHISYSLFCDANNPINIGYSAHEIILNRVVFYKNMLESIVKQGISVPMNECIEYVYNGSDKSQLAMTVKEDSTSVFYGHDIDLTIDNKNLLNKKTIRWSLAVLAVGGSAGWLGGFIKAEEYDSKYYDQTSVNGAVNMRQKRDKMNTARNLGMALCGIASGCFSLTFLF